MPVEYQKLSPDAQQKYNRWRNERIVSFAVKDPETKQRLLEAAKADGRSLNNWITKYVVPHMEAELKKQAQEATKTKSE